MTVRRRGTGRRTPCLVVLAVVIALVVAGRPGGAQQKGEWPTITGGDTGTRYSALDQINASNFNTLKVAWEWNGDAGPDVEIGDINGRSLPIYVDGMLHDHVGSAPHRASRWTRRRARRCGASRSR